MKCEEQRRVGNSLWILELAAFTQFVREVLDIIELDEIRDCLVGIPFGSGLSTEQRKRLTIAVELVANPSIIFMDGPTTGLDARAAAIVMRAVKNVADTDIAGVPKIRNNYNPATWMLEVTSLTAEDKLGIDFAQVYKKSSSLGTRPTSCQVQCLPYAGFRTIFRYG